MSTRSFRNKWIPRVVMVLGVVFMYFYAPWPLPQRRSDSILIAHRGVHHTFPFDTVENDTCTASIIYPPEHDFLENTIPSIRKAFEYGADMVELDIHPTTDDQLAVFHDWKIDCRTEGKGVTHEQSMGYLKTLDIGYGYTADGGQTYPLRGKGRGMMPTLREVLDEFPDKKLAINQKDTFERTVLLLAETLKSYPSSVSANIYFFSDTRQYELLKQHIPEVQKILPTRAEEKACIPEYLRMLVTGQISSECKKYPIGIPASVLRFVPGWPHLFLYRAHQAGLGVYIIDVDTLEEYERIKGLPLDGIVTNTIEIIGPRIQSAR